MKKILGAIAALAMTVGLAACGTPVSQGTTNPNQLVVGMEAGYPPFNWTQNDDSNGAVKIQGTDQYAGGYDVEIAKRVAEKLGKELVDPNSFHYVEKNPITLFGLLMSVTLGIQNAAYIIS